MDVVCLIDEDGKSGKVTKGKVYYVVMANMWGEDLISVDVREDNASAIFTLDSNEFQVVD
jgi:hypothetical protein